MDEITLNAINIFNKNLQYFKENQEELYKKITLLSTLIEEHQYIEKYALEYKDEKYFDIKELASGEYLYNENSIAHAQAMTDIVDTKRSGGTFKALKYVYATDEQAKVINKSELSFHNSLWATVQIINYVTQYTPPTSYMKKVPKVIFLGLGLGLHLKKIINKLNAQIVFVKEQNLEILRLSLFVTDYVELSKDKTFYFSTTNDDNNEKEIFLKFLNNGNNYNLHIKHIPFFTDYSSQLRKLQEYVLSQDYINYGYSAILLRYIDSPKYLARNFDFLNVSKVHQDNIFSHKPLLLLFSGPSTQKNIEWIKQNHKKFIVISALSTCRLLNRVNISPDIVLHIDPGENTSKLFEGIDTSVYFKNTHAILASNVNEDTVNRFKKEQVHFIEQGTTYKKGFARLSAPSVGEYAYALSLIFGAKDLYLLGIDLALDSETLETHGDDHFAKSKGQINVETASLDPNALVEYIPGNLKELVPSQAGYKLSIEQFKIFTEVLKKDHHNIYNLSDGAYLEGANPLQIENYDWNTLNEINKIEIFPELKSFFIEIGSSIFTKEDREQIEYQISEAKRLKKTILTFQKHKFKSVEEFLNTLAQLSWDLSDMDYKTNSNLAQVYYEYFPIVQNYIFDLFNTQSLINPKHHISEMHRILVTQLLKISELYITKIQNYLA